MAIVHVSEEISGTESDTGEKNPTHRELNTRVLVKENGRWSIAAFHNTAVLPAIFTGGH